MDLFSKLIALPDHALAAHYVIENCGPLTLATMREITGKSQASVYRSLSILRDAGLIVDHGKYVLLPTQTINGQKPHAPVVKDEPPELTLPAFLLQSPFGPTGSTLQTRFTKAA